MILSFLFSERACTRKFLVLFSTALTVQVLVLCNHGALGFVATKTVNKKATGTAFDFLSKTTTTTTTKIAPVKTSTLFGFLAASNNNINDDNNNHNIECDGSPSSSSSCKDSSRRMAILQTFTAAFAATTAAPGITTALWALSSPPPAFAATTTRLVLDKDTGEYVEVTEEDWQTAWKQRLDKASSMSKEEIFQAARGAGNVNLKQTTTTITNEDGSAVVVVVQEESPASKKRRAMSACRDATVRTKANAGTEKDCTARVFSGEVDFLLNVL